MSGIVIVSRMKLQNTVGKQITILDGLKRRLLIERANKFLERSNKTYIL